MARSQSLALVGGGQVSKSFLVRLPRLGDCLGPVKASSFRLASRIVNTMRTGHAVERYEDFRDCRLILIHLPDVQLARALREMEAADLEWHNKAILLCDTILDSSELSAFSARGASTGSLNPVEGFDERRFVVEGDRATIRAARRLTQDHDAEILEIETTGKALYAAGLVFATSLFTPLAAAGVECLKKAGLKRGPAAAIIERLIQRSLRGYLKAGRRSWGGPLATSDRDIVLRHLEALFKTNPLMASYYTENALFALRLFRRDSEWLRNLSPEPARRAAGAT